MGRGAATSAIASGANQVSTITTGANVRSFTYLASGQVSQDVRDATHTYGFTANKNGRNASASLNGTTVGSYLYNAYEQRVQKIAGGATVQFVYDLAGHLIEEADGSGNPLREYIWLDDLPVAMLDDTGVSPVLYYIHTDQLGTPQKITDGTKTVAWDAAMDPFGNPVSILGTLTNNLRFPGQYADAETALNQNWNRDYDPSLGRYIQSDPIGLSGGINSYSYVLSNPVVDIDFLGLQSAVPGAAPGVPFFIPPIAQPGSPENQQWVHLVRHYLDKLEECLKQGVDCNEQLKKCRAMCLDIYVHDPQRLPGVGPDHGARMRRCVRECMESNGCHNF